MLPCEISIHLSFSLAFKGYLIHYSDGKGLYDLALNVCGALGNKYASKCSNSSSVCQLKPNDASFAKSTGSYLSSELAFINGELTLTMSNGLNCRSGLSRRTVISFKCDPLNTTNTIRFIDEHECVYYLEWETFYSCNNATRTKQTPNNACQVYDNKRNHTFDFSFLSEKNYTIKSDNYTYRLSRICGDANGVAIEREDNDQKKRTILGYSNKMKIAQLSDHTLLSYEGEKCAESAHFGTFISIECSPFRDLEPFVDYELDCITSIVWPMREACVESTGASNDCAVYFDGVVYDLSPLKHAKDSWYVPNETNNYWLNVCSGIHIGPGNSTQCPPNASVCSMSTTATKKVETLAYESQMQLRMREGDKNRIEMTFVNYQRPCHSNGTANFTLSVVEFTCGESVGRAELNSEFRPDYAIKAECVHAFSWKTMFACKEYNTNNLKLRVNFTNDGLVYDPNNRLKLNLTELFKEAHWSSSGEKSKFGIGLSRNSFTLANCSEALICQVTDEKNVRDIGTHIVASHLDSYLKSLEIVLASKHATCSTGESVKSIVRFHCVNSSNDKFMFETQSNDCMYFFEWPTSKLCDLMAEPNSSVATTTTVATLTTTATTTATTATNTTTTNSSSSTDKCHPSSCSPSR